LSSPRFDSNFRKLVSPSIHTPRERVKVFMPQSPWPRGSRNLHHPWAPSTHRRAATVNKEPFSARAGYAKER